MREVGAFEAKTHLSALLEAAEAGESILITRRGKPVARLGPIGGENPADIQRSVARIRALRTKASGLSASDILSARDEGRR